MSQLKKVHITGRISAGNSLGDAGRLEDGVLRRYPVFRLAKEIFNTYFRNSQGHFGDVLETYPDDGDIDMLRAIRVYKEVGYDGMLMPDDASRVPGDQRGRLAFAFGYIQAALQTVGMHA